MLGFAEFFNSEECSYQFLSFALVADAAPEACMPYPPREIIANWAELQARDDREHVPLVDQSFGPILDKVNLTEYCRCGVSGADFSEN